VIPPLQVVQAPAAQARNACPAFPGHPGQDGGVCTYRAGARRPGSALWRVSRARQEEPHLVLDLLADRRADINSISCRVDFCNVYGSCYDFVYSIYPSDGTRVDGSNRTAANHAQLAC
jgi:hypothetical protein